MDVDKLKKQRTQTRRQFTSLKNVITGELKKEDPDLQRVQSDFDTLKSIQANLCEEDNLIIDLMYEADAKDDEVNDEADKAMVYQRDFNYVKRLVSDKVKSDESVKSEGGFNSALKLPKISLRVFTGELADWLPFWSQFKQIHESETLPATSKFTYLLNSLKKGTSAYKIVAGYPVTEENYEKAIESLEERYGNNDILLQVHVRELLKLFMQNIEAKKKLTLIEFHDDLETHLKSLEALKFYEADPATILYPLVESCLPKEVLLAWQRSPDAEIEPKKGDPKQSRLAILRNFVKKEVRRHLNVEIAETGFQDKANHSRGYSPTAKDSNSSPSQKKGRQFRSKREEVPTLAGLKISEIACVFCDKSNHASKDCFKASKMPMEEKAAFLKTKNVCFICLLPGHFARNCKVKLKCNKCNSSSHYAVMCGSSNQEKTSERGMESRVPQPGPSHQPTSEAKAVPLQGCANQTCTDQVLLQTMLVKVEHEGGTKTARLFMDPGSQRSYIRKALAESLKLPVMNTEANRHALFGGKQTELTYHKTHFAKIWSMDGKCYSTMLLKGHDVICGAIPRLREGHPVVKELSAQGFHLTDVGKGEPTIDILIGSDYYGRLLEDRKVPVGYGLTALETCLGWVVAGETRKRDMGNTLALTLLTMHQTETDLSKLWDLEAIGIQESPEAISKEKSDEEAIRAFQDKINRKEDGRYVVSLPWKEGYPPLPDNRVVAAKRLEATTRKLRKTDMYQKYNQVFLDWENEGFIEKVTKDSVGCSKSSNSVGCSKSISSVDCSKSSNSVDCSKSSNSVSCSNPRTIGGSISRDIGCSYSGSVDGSYPNNSCSKSKIYSDSDLRSRQVHYIPHRPVFKASPTTPVRPVFDASCKVGDKVSLNDCLETGANFISLIQDYLLRFREKEYGIISDIRKAFQMIEVVETDRDACRFLWWDEKGEIVEYRHARVMFGATCSPFVLGAVIDHHLSNVKEDDRPTALKLKESMYVDNCVTSVDSMDVYEKFMKDATRIMADAKMDLRLWMSNGDFLEDDEIVPVLGLQWDRNFDRLFVDTKAVIVPEKVTPRVVLSTIAKVFDVLGFLSPAILPVKMLLQRAWILQLKWDDDLPGTEALEFLKFVEDLPRLKKVQIYRLATQGVTDRRCWSLHLFTDASQDAYAAVVFLRVESGPRVTVSLLAAKSRVAPAPTKKKKRITIPRAELMGALIGSRLLASVKKALKIEDDVETHCWSDSMTAISWIRNEKPWGTFVGNRVKEIRVVTPSELWHHVPGEMNPADLPSRGCSIPELEESRWWEGPDWLRRPREEWPSHDGEVDVYAINSELKKTAQTEIAVSNLESLTIRSLTFNQTVKMLAWIIRIQKNSRMPKEERNLLFELTNEELSNSKRRLVQIAQDEANEAIGGVCSKKQMLTTVKASDGVWCVQTRLSYRDDLPSFKYPMLLPKDHEITRKLVEEEHIRHHHAGVNFLMARIREEFWIPQMRKVIKNVIRKCQRCYRHKVKCSSTVEAPLPLDRVKDTEVFDVVGVDLAGPFVMKGGNKAWIVLYTCAVYRALHLDVVTTLSTPAFIKSLNDFVTTYHRPTIIYSDNGTNFHGAENLFGTLDWKTIQEEEGFSQIQWKFNPPSAAWWGGWWERLVRSVKELLKRNLGRASVTISEFKKVLQDIQMVINGRLLTYVSEDVDDLQPLTPMMFLNPAALLPCGFPEEELTVPEKLRKRYKYIQNLKVELRRRFRAEYLGQLKTKPSKATPELKVGGIVLVGHENMKRLDWPLARILELYPGKDKVERVALIRTKDGIYKRPVQRLYKMETDDCTATEIKKSLRGRPIKIPDRYKC